MTPVNTVPWISARHGPYVVPSVKRPGSSFVLAALLASAISGCGDSTTTPPPVDATLDTAADATADVPLDLAVTCDVELPADASTVAPTFANVRSFFMRRCAAGSACHGNGGQGDLTLLGPALYDDLVRHPSAAFPALPRVEPGNLDRSFLWLKVSGCFTQLPGCRNPGGTCGDPMPTLSPISEGFALSEAAVMRAWIAAGAPP